MVESRYPPLPRGPASRVATAVAQIPEVVGGKHYDNGAVSRAMIRSASVQRYEPADLPNVHVTCVGNDRMPRKMLKDIPLSGNRKMVFAMTGDFPKSDPQRCFDLTPAARSHDR